MIFPKYRPISNFRKVSFIKMHGKFYSRNLANCEDVEPMTSPRGHCSMSKFEQTPKIWFTNRSCIFFHWHFSFPRTSLKSNNFFRASRTQLCPWLEKNQQKLSNSLMRLLFAQLCAQTAASLQLTSRQKFILGANKKICWAFHQPKSYCWIKICAVWTAIYKKQVNNFWRNGKKWENECGARVIGVYCYRELQAWSLKG